MAPSITFNTSIFGSQVSISGTETTTVSGQVGQLAAPDILPATAGELTTRTNDTSGVITVAAGHSFETGMRVDLYWADGQCYGATLGTVDDEDDTTIPIASVTGGDALPDAATDIIMCEAVAYDLPFDHADLKAIVATAGSARSYFAFDNGTYNLNVQYLAASETYYWHNELSIANPFLGELPTRVFISHADTDRTITDSKVAVVTGD